MSKESTNPLSSDYDTTINLLNVYLTEINHRDDQFWNQTFKYFFGILFLIILPNIANGIGISLPSIPTCVFRFSGILLDFLFLLISLGYNIRYKAVSDTYAKIIKTLPPDYQRIYISNKIFGKRISIVATFTMFTVLLIISVIFLVG